MKNFGNPYGNSYSSLFLFFILNTGCFFIDCVYSSWYYWGSNLCNLATDRGWKILMRDNGMWLTAPEGMTRGEVIAHYDTTIHAVHDKTIGYKSSKHKISYQETFSGTFNWKCNICGPIATVTIMRE